MRDDNSRNVTMQTRVASSIPPYRALFRLAEAGATGPVAVRRAGLGRGRPAGLPGPVQHGRRGRRVRRGRRLPPQRRLGGPAHAAGPEAGPHRGGVEGREGAWPGCGVGAAPPEAGGPTHMNQLLKKKTGLSTLRSTIKNASWGGLPAFLKIVLLLLFYHLDKNDGE